MDEAAGFLSQEDYRLLVLYDKEDLSFRDIIKQAYQRTSIPAIVRKYNAARSRLREAIATAAETAATTQNGASLTTNVNTLASDISSVTMTEPNTTSNGNQAEEREFIPQDDPRRIYRVPGMPYGFCQPFPYGNFSGYPNNPEEQKFVDDQLRMLKEKYKNATVEEARADLAALVKKVNEDFEAERLLTLDIDRQMAELTAQREVERRVYYRQKALKEAKKKEKEERKRARAIARGEVVEEGEGSGAAIGQAQGGGERPSGAVENDSTGAHDKASITENGSMTAQDQAL